MFVLADWLVLNTHVHQVSRSSLTRPSVGTFWPKSTRPRPCLSLQLAGGSLLHSSFLDDNNQGPPYFQITNGTLPQGDTMSSSCFPPSRRRPGGKLYVSLSMRVVVSATRKLYTNDDSQNVLCCLSVLTVKEYTPWYSTPIDTYEYVLRTVLCRPGCPASFAG